MSKSPFFDGGSLDDQQEDAEEAFQKVSKAAIGVLVTGAIGAIVVGYAAWALASSVIGLWAVLVAIIAAFAGFYIIAAITGLLFASRGVF